jgi:hypothetical protein
MGGRQYRSFSFNRKDGKPISAGIPEGVTREGPKFDHQYYPGEPEPNYQDNQGSFSDYSIDLDGDVLSRPEREVRFYLGEISPGTPPEEVNQRLLSTIIMKECP